MSNAAEGVVLQETGYSPDEVKKLASVTYEEANLFAPITSGSYAVNIQTMCIIPCSMKTLAAIANGYSDNLISRAADVCIKENKKLLIVPRETPFSAIHLQNMLTLSRSGVTIMPPVPAFYTGDKTIEGMVSHFTGRVLDQLGVVTDIKRWGQS